MKQSTTEHKHRYRSGWCGWVCDCGHQKSNPQVKPDAETQTVIGRKLDALLSRLG